VFQPEKEFPLYVKELAERAVPVPATIVWSLIVPEPLFGKYLTVKLFPVHFA
jgi:hypothetical protein